MAASFRWIGSDAPGDQHGDDLNIRPISLLLKNICALHRAILIGRPAEILPAFIIAVRSGIGFRRVGRLRQRMIQRRPPDHHMTIGARCADPLERLAVRTCDVQRGHGERSWGRECVHWAVQGWDVVHQLNQNLCETSVIPGTAPLPRQADVSRDQDRRGRPVSAALRFSGEWEGGGSMAPYFPIAGR